MKASEYFRFLVESPVANIAKYYIDVYLKSPDAKPLSDFLTDIRTGKTPSKNNSRYYESEDFDWFKPNEIGLGIYLKDAQDKVSNYAVKENQVTIFQPETLLINCIGDIGRVSILQKEASSNQQITGVRFNKNVLPEYAFFYFVSHRNLLVDDAPSTTLPILNQKKLLSIPFKVPDIREQKKILLYLNDCLDCLTENKTPEFSRYDFDKSLLKISKEIFSLYYFQKELLNEFNSQQTLITRLRQSILQEAVQGKLVKQNKNDEPASELLKRIKAEKEKLFKQGKLKKEKPLPPISENEIPYQLPEGWVWCRLGEIITIKGGKRVPNGYQLLSAPTKHIYIRVTDMKNGTIPDNDLRYISDDVYEGIKNYIIRKEDLYITIAGTIGDVGEVPEKFDGMNLTENAARIITYATDKTFLRNILTSKFIQDQFIDKTNQLAQPKLALSRIQTTLFPLPPLPEQKRIVEKVNQLMQHCNELEQQVQQSITHAQQLMQAVLREVFEKKEKMQVTDAV